MTKQFAITILLITAVSSASMASSSESEVKGFSSGINPTNPTQKAQKTMTEKAAARATTPQAVSAGVDMVSEGHLSSTQAFQDPALFMDHGFITSNDNRSFGVEEFQYNLQLGMDFATYYDFVVGFMYTYAHRDGEVDDTPGAILDIDSSTHLFSVYVSRMIYDYLIAGATMSLGYDRVDQEITGAVVDFDFDRFIVSPSAFFGFAKAWDTWSLSSIASYIYEESHWNPDGNFLPTGAFNQNTSTFTWNNKATYFLCDTWDIAGEFGLTQIIDTNVSTLPDDDDFWGTIGASTSWRPNSHWQVTARVLYDILNDNYQETVTGSIGATYQF